MILGAAMPRGPDDPSSATETDAARAVERALAAARPLTPDDPARALRRRAARAAVLGDEDDLPRVGPYRIEARVGAGGMGVVFRARDAQGTRVAIKLLRQEAARERSRFRREAELLRGISHPNVVRYLDHGVTDEGVDYLVMEWLEGRDLAARLAQGPLPAEGALRLATVIAGALRAAHEAGVVHRDVKPGNVFLAGDDFDAARLLDFGIAKGDLPAHATLTATGALLGSPQYMAPEQLRGAHDARTDVYGLGATLFDALTGRAPFVGAHPAAVLLAVATEPPPSLRALRPELNPALDVLVARMLAKDPRDRPRDMHAVLVELADLGARPARLPAAPAVSFDERAPEVVATAPGESPAAGVVDAPTGRARAFALALGACAECAEDHRAALLVLTGNAGAGKSHLLAALAHTLEGSARDGRWTVRHARGREDDAGAPFAALRGVLSGADAPEARALEALLRELPGLGPERVEAWADAVQLAWFELLDAWTARGPVALLLDDAWAADTSTLRALDRALAHLGARPLVVVAATRRAPDSLALGAALPPERRAHVQLGPLSPRAAERLAAGWMPGAPPSERADRVALAAGDPSLLRALCQAPADARRVGSLAELVWVRLGALDPADRRVLRAGAVVGRTFWRSALAALLDVAAGDPRLAASLASLSTAGWVRAVEGDDGGDPCWEFDSELVQRAAYELNTPETLRRGHGEVARWMIAQRRGAPGAIARHLARAGREDEALPLHLDAAAEALAGGAGEEAAAQLDAAAHLASRPADLARLAALRAHLAFWAGRLDEAMTESTRALADTPAGEAAWFERVCLAVTAAGQRGDNTSVRALATRAHAASPLDDTAADSRRTALCRAFTQLALVGDVPPWLRDAVLGEGAKGVEARAWRARARGTDAAQRSFDEAIDAFVEAHRAHLEGRDRRSAAQVGLYLGSYLVWSGAFERAREVIDDAMRTAARLDASYLLTWGRYTRAKLLVEESPGEGTLRVLDAVADETRGSPRMLAGARIYASLAAHRVGRWSDAERCARAVLDRAASAQVTRAGAAALCRALIAQGRAIDAAPLSPALTALPTMGAVSEFDELVMLARVELADALHGAPDEALAEALACIEARAATLRDPLRRNEYRTRPHLVARTFALR